MAGEQPKTPLSEYLDGLTKASQKRQSNLASLQELNQQGTVNDDEFDEMRASILHTFEREKKEIQARRSAREALVSTEHPVGSGGGSRNAQSLPATNHGGSPIHIEFNWVTWARTVSLNHSLTGHYRYRYLCGVPVQPITNHYKTTQPTNQPTIPEPTQADTRTWLVGSPCYKAAGS